MSIYIKVGVENNKSSNVVIKRSNIKNAIVKFSVEFTEDSKNRAIPVVKYEEMLKIKPQPNIFFIPTPTSLLPPLKNTKQRFTKDTPYPDEGEDLYSDVKDRKRFTKNTIKFMRCGILDNLKNEIARFQTKFITFEDLARYKNKLIERYVLLGYDYEQCLNEGLQSFDKDDIVPFLNEEDEECYCSYFQPREYVSKETLDRELEEYMDEWGDEQNLNRNETNEEMKNQEYDNIVEKFFSDDEIWLHTYGRL
jgi:hypothetical protein